MFLPPWLPVLVAAAGSFLLGGLWYSPLLFGRLWQRLAGLTDEQLKQGNPAKIFGLSFVFAVLAALTFGMFLGPSPALELGLGAGAIAGFAWVGAGLGITGLFERRPLGLWAINAGYQTCTFVLYGLIFALWP